MTGCVVVTCRTEAAAVCVQEATARGICVGTECFPVVGQCPLGGVVDGGGVFGTRHPGPHVVVLLADAQVRGRVDELFHNSLFDPLPEHAERRGGQCQQRCFAL